MVLLTLNCSPEALEMFIQTVGLCSSIVFVTPVEWDCPGRGSRQSFAA